MRVDALGLMIEESENASASVFFIGAISDEGILVSERNNENVCIAHHFHYPSCSISLSKIPKC